jgi:hypothetical protein
MQNFHVQRREDLQFQEIKTEAHIPKSKSKDNHNGLTAMYNLWVDLDLGLGQIALKPIPYCACAKCMKQMHPKC